MTRHILAQLNAAQSQLTKARTELLALPKEHLVDLCISLATEEPVAVLAQYAKPVLSPVSEANPEASAEPSPLAIELVGLTVAECAQAVLRHRPGLTTQQIKDALHKLGRDVEYKSLHWAMGRKPSVFVSSSPGPGMPLAWSLKRGPGRPRKESK